MLMHPSDATGWPDPVDPGEHHLYPAPDAPVPSPPSLPESPVDPCSWETFGSPLPGLGHPDPFGLPYC